MTLAVLHPATGEPIVDPKTGDTVPPIITVSEAAKLIGLPRDVVTRYCQDGQFPSMVHRPGDPWRIPAAKLLRALGMLPEDSFPDPSDRGTAPQPNPPLGERAAGIPASHEGSGGDHRKGGAS